MFPLLGLGTPTTTKPTRDASFQDRVLGEAQPHTCRGKVACVTFTSEVPYQKGKVNAIIDLSYISIYCNAVICN